jgi:hypothetical protein
MKNIFCRWAATVAIVTPVLAARAANLVIENVDGPVTAREIAAFKVFMPGESASGNNAGNRWVYGSAGKDMEALGMVYEISKDRELLDQMIRFADAALACRNDSSTGRVIWTGQRELCWPNARPNAGDQKYSGSENGDVIAHIACCAKWILKTPALAGEKVGIGDPHGYGATYRQRALTYVREMDRTIDSFILPWFVSATDSNHYRWPDTPRYTTNRGGTPIPWNQQTMLSGGFLRQAECHELLADDPARVKKYYQIVRANLDWFLSDLHLESRGAHPVFDWGYSLGRRSEDVPHGGYDIWGLCRAYETGKFGIPAATMTNFANTLYYVVYDPTNQTFHMRVDGKDANKAARKSIAASWSLLAEFGPAATPDLYHVVAEANRESAQSRPLEAAFILWLKNRRHPGHG